MVVFDKLPNFFVVFPVLLGQDQGIAWAQVKMVNNIKWLTICLD